MIESANYPYSTEYIETTAAYVRVSTQEQKLHGLSLDAQRQKLEEYAEKNNLKIVEWYVDEGVSGRKPIKKRPELQRMIKDAQQKKFKRIIFIKLDRFFRSVAEYHECMKLIDPVLWTATEEKYDLSTANGRAFVNMKITIAELEADQTGERIQIVNDYKVKAGRPLVGTKCMPFCYEVVTNGKEKEIQKHSEYKDIMMDCIEHIEMHKSVRAAMSYVNNKYGTTFSYKRILSALKNEMIAGAYRGNPNYCDPYITRERFEALQQIIRRTPRTTVRRAYLFPGLLVCPHCGRKLRGTQHQSNTSVGGKEYKYSYNAYRCQRNRMDKACTFKTMVFEHKIEELMLEKLNLIVENKKIASVQIRPKEGKVNKYNLEELQAELDRLNYSWQKGRIKKVEEYDKKYDELTYQIEQATKEISDSVEAPDFSEIEAILQSGWQGVYRKLDMEHKRAFWLTFVDKIHLNWNPHPGIKEIRDVDFL